MESYEEILGRMEENYLSLTGMEAGRVGDTQIKLQLLAGEIYALQSNIDWLQRQLLPDTATGEQLDLHAQQCGVKRHSGSKARGDIAFIADMPPEFDVVIPAGTICTTADGRLNYITEADSIIRRGESFGLATASAEHSGKQYNVAPGTITTIVTYFSVGLSVGNTSAFAGGTDDEDDESLRRRLAASCRNISNGANGAYYIRLAESVDGVGSASVVGSDGSFTLYVVGVAGAAGDAVMARVRALVEENLCIGVTMHVFAGALLHSDIELAVKPKSGYSFSQVQANVQTAADAFYKSLRIGEAFTLAALGGAVIAAEGVENYSFTTGHDISPGQSALVVLHSLTVSELT